MFFLNYFFGTDDTEAYWASLVFCLLQSHLYFMYVRKTQVNLNDKKGLKAAHREHPRQ